MPAKRVVTAEEGLEQVVGVHRVEGEVSEPQGCQSETVSPIYGEEDKTKKTIVYEIIIQICYLILIKTTTNIVSICGL